MKSPGWYRVVQSTVRNASTAKPVLLGKLFSGSMNTPNVSDVPDVAHTPKVLSDLTTFGRGLDKRMLRLKIGSGMRRLSSCMLSICRGPKSKAREGRAPLPCSHLGPRPMLSMHELSLPEPMLSLSMVILATCLQHA